jgi:hypothetical protein
MDSTEAGSSPLAALHVSPVQPPPGDSPPRKKPRLPPMCKTLWPTAVKSVAASPLPMT